MPGGKGNIKPQDGKPYSSTYQPANRRKSTRFLTELLTKELEGRKEITIEGFDVFSGEKTKVRIPMPTKQMIVRALLRKASDGDINAIREIFDRIEGRAMQDIQLKNDEENPINFNNVPLELLLELAKHIDHSANKE